MSDVRYARSHRLGRERARAVAQQTADDLAAEYDLASEWHGDTLHFHRSGVEGWIRVEDDRVELEIRLGFLLRPFASRLEENVARHFDQLLDEAAAGPGAEAAGGPGAAAGVRRGSAATRSAATASRGSARSGSAGAAKGKGRGGGKGKP